MSQQIFKNVAVTGDLELAGKIYPSADSTTAVGIFKADGTTNVLNVDTTNSRVGIGTTEPATALQVYSTGSAQGMFNGWSTIAGANGPLNGEILLGSNASYRGRFGYTATGNTILAIDNTYVNNASAMQFRFGTAAKMTILGNGNVGIGTTTPTGKLNVLSTTEQLRVAYDVSNYLSATVGVTGSVTFALTGTTPINIFSQAVKFAGGTQSSDGSAGVTGSFTSADSKTVTVKNGLITSIA